MKNLFFCFFLITLFEQSQAQKNLSVSLPRYELRASVSFLQSFNQGERFGNNLQRQLIFPKNTVGYEAGLDLNRRLSRNLLASLGVAYGQQNHRVAINQDASNFDPSAVENLRDLAYNGKANFNQKYLHFDLSLGYTTRIVNRLEGFLKAGAGYQIDLNNKYGRDVTNIVYSPDSNEGLIKNSIFNTVDSRFGSTPDVAIFSSYPWHSMTPYMKLSLGFNYKLNWRFADNIYTEILFMKDIRHYTDGNATVYVNYAEKFDEAYNKNYENYTVKNLLLGIKVGVDLWHSKR